MARDLPAIKRPNGKDYQPRKIIAHSWENDTVHDSSAGVVVLGTHDVERARVLADSCVKSWFGSELSAVEPEPGWYRLGYERGEPMWMEDERRGRAGVWFTAKEVVSGD